MLVIASNLVLSAEDAALPPGTPRILWDNIATFGTVTADSEAAGFPISNVTNPATNQEWRAAAAEDVEITVTIGTVDEIDAVGIARHNFGDAEISVEIGYYDEDDEWVNLAGPQMPADNEPLLFQFTPQSLSEIVIKLPEGNAAARMAVLYVGPMMIMPRGVDIEDYAVPRDARKTETVSPRSQAGDYLGTVVTSQYIEPFEHKYSHLEADFVNDELRAFIAAVSIDQPCFYAMRSDDGVSYHVAYVWFPDGSDPKLKKSPATQRYQLVIVFTGIIR